MRDPRRAEKPYLVPARKHPKAEFRMMLPMIVGAVILLAAIVVLGYIMLRPIL